MKTKRHRSRSPASKRHKKRKYDELLKEIKLLKEKFSQTTSDESDVSSVENDEIHSERASVDEGVEESHGEEIEIPETGETQGFFDLLGSNPPGKNMECEPLHEEIKKRWNNYLTEGLVKEQREDIVKKYPFFENCPLLTPPKLNPEVLDSKALRHDQFLENLQLQVGHTLSAVGLQLNKILSVEEKEPMKETFSVLADVGQLVCNIHHALSTSRKYQILPYLNYNTRKMVENASRDEFLLGKKCVEEVKSKEAMKKVAKDLKIAKPQLKPFDVPGTSRQNFQAPQRVPKVSGRQQPLNIQRPPPITKKKQTNNQIFTRKRQEQHRPNYHRKY